MSSDSKSKGLTSLRFFSWVMTIVLAISIFSVFYSIVALFILPTPSEYAGTFPSEPPFLSGEFWTALSNGILRHLAVLNQHIYSQSLINIIGLAFTTLLVYTVKEKVAEMRENEKNGKRGEVKIDEYVKWAFGSLIAAIITSASNVIIRPYLANVILILLISIFILYILYPRYGIMFTIKDWISSKITKEEEKGKK